MELKLPSLDKSDCEEGCSNRTFMELKFQFQVQGLSLV